MSETRTFEWDDVMDDGVEIDYTDWRWGTRKQILMHDTDGQAWAGWVDVHVDDGWQTHIPFEAIKVKPIEVTVKKWVPA